MGIFGNSPEEVHAASGGEGPVMPLYPFGAPQRNQGWHGQSGFDAMGHQVPPFRKTEGEKHLKSMGFNKPGDAERRYDLIARMSDQIARDNSHGAMEEAYKMGLDVTGVYRLLAVLLCAEEPKPEPAKPAYYGA